MTKTSKDPFLGSILSEVINNLIIVFNKEAESRPEKEIADIIKPKLPAGRNLSIPVASVTYSQIVEADLRITTRQRSCFLAGAPILVDLMTWGEPQ